MKRKEETRHADHRLSGPRVRGEHPEAAVGQPCRTGHPHVTGDEMVAAMDASRRRRRDLHLVPSRCTATTAATPKKSRASHPGRMAIVKPVDPDDKNVAERGREVEGDEGSCRHPHLPARGGEARRRTSRSSTASARLPWTTTCRSTSCSGAAVDDGIKIIDRHPGDALHRRSSRPAAAARPAGAGRAVGRSAEDPGARQAPERRDQGERRLHALQAALSRSPTSGTR